jgi:type I restriction enzyme M protein
VREGKGRRKKEEAGGAVDEIAKHGYVLTPGRYVGAAKVEEDGEPLVEKLNRLTATLEAQFAESARLENDIRGNLKRLRG